MGNKSKSRNGYPHQLITWAVRNLHTRDAKEIARTLDTTERTVQRWAEQEKWEDLLTILNYEGELNFRVRKAGRKRKAD